jgi:hypothetical protein
MARPKKTEGAHEEKPAKQPKGFAMPPVRGSEAWRGWVDRLIDHDRSSWPDLVDKALVAYAKAVGFKEAPPRR